MNGRGSFWLCLPPIYKVNDHVTLKISMDCKLYLFCFLSVSILTMGMMKWKRIDAKFNCQTRPQVILESILWCLLPTILWVSSLPLPVAHVKLAPNLKCLPFIFLSKRTLAMPNIVCRLQMFHDGLLHQNVSVSICFLTQYFPSSPTLVSVLTRVSQWALSLKEALIHGKTKIPNQHSKDVSQGDNI